VDASRAVSPGWLRPSLKRSGSRWIPLLFGIAFAEALVAQPLAYPAAHRESVSDDYHGIRVSDPYRWLEQLDGRRTLEWIAAENRLTSGYFSRIRDRETIRRRLDSLWNSPRTDVPWREAGDLFFVANTGQQPQPALYRQTSREDSPTLVFDPNRISPDGSIAVRDYQISPDGRLLAYWRSRGGADVGETRVRDLASGRDLSDVVHDTLTSVCWSRDEGGFFYVRGPTPAGGDPAQKRVFYHSIGRPQSEDHLVHDWKGNARWVYCMLADDGRRALIVVEQGTESEMNVVDLVDPKRPHVTARIVRLLRGSPGFHTPIDTVGSTLYVRTTLEAPNRRVIALDLEQGADARPRTIIPESSEAIADAVIAGDRIVVHYLADAKSRLRVFALDGRPEGEIPLPGIGAVGWPLSARHSTSELFYSFESFLAPRTVYRYDPVARTSIALRPPRLRFDPGKYETRQVFYESKDGTRIPMFVTASKDVKLDGTNPTLLTGYGGYGVSREPGYEPDVPLWLQLGGVYAVANIRGGGEYGEEWHRAGMLERKQNSFDDFIAAAEYLVSRRYTRPERLAIYGHSNGGLLIGAVITQRPDLFAAAVANAGHYDMLRYDRFTAGAGWVTEYGSPMDPTAFRSLRAYSPLHNVRTGACYPATLMLAADHDDRVVPSHSYKFAAALQAAQGCARPILLRVATDASHSYASGRTQRAERTDLWAFIVSRLGVRVPGRPTKPAARGSAP
jgi:prolyl oligopeptidase